MCNKLERRLLLWIKNILYCPTKDSLFIDYSLLLHITKSLKSTSLPAEWTILILIWSCSCRTVSHNQHLCQIWNESKYWLSKLKHLQRCNGDGFNANGVVANLHPIASYITQLTKILSYINSQNYTINAPSGPHTFQLYDVITIWIQIQSFYLK